MKKKKSIIKNIVLFKSLPPPPRNLSAAGYRHNAAVLEELQANFRPVMEGMRKLNESIDNLCEVMNEYKRERERLNKILRHPVARKKFHEAYKLHGRVFILDFPLHEIEIANEKESQSKTL